MLQVASLPVSSDLVAVATLMIFAMFELLYWKLAKWTIVEQSDVALGILLVIVMFLFAATVAISRPLDYTNYRHRLDCQPKGQEWQMCASQEM